jgi:hypothetical protein
MPRIFDNIEEQLLPAFKGQSLKASEPISVLATLIFADGVNSMTTSKDGRAVMATAAGFSSECRPVPKKN